MSLNDHFQDLRTAAFAGGGNPKLPKAVLANYFVILRDVIHRTLWDDSQHCRKRPPAWLNA